MYAYQDVVIYRKIIWEIMQFHKLNQKHKKRIAQEKIELTMRDEKIKM